MWCSHCAASSELYFVSWCDALSVGTPTGLFPFPFSLSLVIRVFSSLSSTRPSPLVVSFGSALHFLARLQSSSHRRCIDFACTLPVWSRVLPRTCNMYAVAACAILQGEDQSSKVKQVAEGKLALQSTIPSATFLP